MSENKPQIVELSDILNDDSLLNKHIEVKGIVVKEYNRGEIEEHKDTISFDGIIEKSNLQLRIEGEEELGTDALCLLSQKYGGKLNMEGIIYQQKDGTKYLCVSEVYL